MVGVVALGVSLIWSHHAWADPTRRFIGDPGDPAQFVWFFRWMPWALAHGHAGLFSTRLLYPAGVNLMWQPSIPLATAILSPVTLLGGPVLSYNIAVSIAPALAAMAGYWFCVRIVGDRLAAGVGGLLIGFSPFVVAHGISHPYLTLGMSLVTVTGVGLHEAWVRQRWRWPVTGLVLGVATAAQVVTGEELLALTAISAVATLAVLSIVGRGSVRVRAPYAVRSMTLGAVVAVVLAAYPLWVQLRGPQRLSVNGVQSSGYYVTDLFGLVLPSNQLGAAPVADLTGRFTGGWAEMTGYLGLPAILLILWLVATHQRRHPYRQTVAVTAWVVLILVVLSFGPRLHILGHDSVPMPWGLLGRLPLVSDALPARIGACTGLFLGLAAALAVVELRRVRRRGAVAVGGLLVTLMAASFVPTRILVSELPAPAYFRAGASGLAPGTVALVLPYSDDASETAPMYWQALSGMRFSMPEGYVLNPRSDTHAGWGPPPDPPLTDTLRALRDGAVPRHSLQLRAELLAQLQTRRVDVVIIGPSPTEAASNGFAAWLSGASAQRYGDVTVYPLPAH